MIYKVKLKDFLKIADIALTRQQACCNMVITKKLYHRTHRVRLRNLGTTDKKSSHKIKHRKIPREHRRTLGGKIENESSYLSRRLRHQDQRRKPFKTKANDRDR